MGIKSDDEILAGLAEYKAERDPAGEAAEAPSGIGEALPDADEESEDDDSDDEDASEESEESEEDEGDSEESDDSEEDSAGDDEEEVAAADDDADADKEIARIQEAEKAAKGRINEKLEELKAKEEESAERLSKAEELEASHARLFKRIRQAPIAAVKSMGIETYQDFLDIGAKFYKYGKSKSPDAKPELQAWAQSVERDGEQDSSVDELRAEIQEMKAAREAEQKQKEEAAQAEKQKAETQSELNTFADSVVQECNGQYPMAQKRISEMGEEEARSKIIGLAEYMFEQNKKVPTQKQILEAVEEYERKELKSLGLNPDELFPRTNSKDKSGTASEKKKAPMKKKKPKKKPKAKTDEEILASLREHREGHLNI